ncbi:MULTISPECIES: glycosyltransferase family 2 protein [Rhodococcus]|uniref:Glycosyltransferase family 2 protein n=1 Tax=Rhodococcus oxybenzonivorans TaxID=1990687 RepID=A0AAE5A8M3_9NOCA|nr:MULTISPECIES: glycosyltransferase family 2 protein [Rhodococcus]MDV7242402.1 glycosyltransferase family 2 protein [Rhodococcus oxybenzonivorans]MDV7268130.1 glycosyltransferase family 2 protein [Rhodococcus oxybenzonivorans]MDV7277149.1 glycosyltransferase family 2 protein [Rhodococcus oxybenzonivorans]MDV7331891.1 glycosyltransferase family 2 protein [Rhodococcus oxybenzonivorans]MDV7344112.1 glycosyltransferase family 2 protein [Rhodococcus oxybenzonivorans]
MTSKTTVVIVTHNRATSLSRTLLELSKLRPIPPIVVVDNASTDDTADVVDAARSVIPALTTITRSRNEGAAARNYGVWAASTPYIAFCDDDSWWDRDALPLAEKVLDEHPAIALLAARTLVGPQARNDPLNDRMACSPLGTRPGAPGPSVLGFLACASVVRRSSFENVGGFSHVLEFVGEEALLALDLAAQGWELCYVEDLVAYHHPSSVRANASRRRNREIRNDTLTVVMRRPVPTVASALISLMFAAVRTPSAAPALFDTIRKLPAAVAHRRVVPTHLERRLEELERSRP